MLMHLCELSAPSSLAQNGVEFPVSGAGDAVGTAM